MKLFKVFSVGAACCLVFTLACADVPSSITTCPIGGGACTTRPMPAGSYTNARAVAGLTSESLRPIVSPLIPPPVAASSPSGAYCGRVALYTDTRSITERVPCEGRSVFGPVETVVYNPPTEAYCGGGDNPVCYEAAPGYYSTVTVLAGDCPAGYSLTTTGASGPYEYYSCIKS